jgi:F-type H+-transporting ATPase subunit epsilon
MRLKLLLPTEILVDQPVSRVRGESAYGVFVVLPRHIDFATLLEPGPLSFETPAGEEQFLAVDAGILVKHGDEVRVATGNAVGGDALSELRDVVENRFYTLDQQEKKARAALARLESDFIRRYLEIES